nr:putative ribonuclease H-like domain-containing protein [Tanacetum cinerariifolium]
MPALEDIIYSDDEEDVGAEADFSNLETSITVSPIPTTRVHKDHPVTQIIGDLSSAPQTRKEPKRVHQALKDPSWIESMQEELLQFKKQKVWVLVDLPKGKRAIGSKWVFKNKKDEKGIVIKNKAWLVAQGHTQEEGIYYEEVFAPLARIEPIQLFLAYASFMGFMVYQMDVKIAFLYETIEEEVYVCQPQGFEDPDYPDKVYKVVKALYESHQAPRAWYETLANYVLENGFQRGKIDQTLFIKQKGDILLVQMSSMGELTFFLGLQVKQKDNGMFISQDKYVAKILRKFGLTDSKSTNTPIDTEKPLLKDPDDITYSDDEEDVGTEADFSSLETHITVSPILITRVHKDHHVTQIIGNLSSAPQTRSIIRMVKEKGGLTQINNDNFQTCMFSCFLSQEEPKRVHQALKDPSWIEATQEELLQFKMQKVWVLVDLPKDGKSASTPIDTEKPLLKDPDGEDVDVHTYMSMIGSSMYLTLSRPGIMYLKGKPHLGLWYPKDLPFDLVAYSDSDYAGASLDRKSVGLYNRLARKNKLKARGTLLMALLDKHQLKFNIHKDAKTLMEAIEKRFSGNKETKKRNKTDLEEQSLDDLFNSLKIYEAKVKSSSSTSTSTQNINFVSSQTTDSTNKPVSAIASVSAASAKNFVSAIPNVDTLSNVMAILNVRARRFLQRTGRNLGANGPTSMGFDMSKVECYNFQRKRHFARKCRSSKETKRNVAAEPQRRNVPVETSTSNALFSKCDGVDNYDWIFQEEEEPTNYALMAFTSLSSFSSDNKMFSSETNKGLPASPIYDRYYSGEGYHVVPPPYTGTFMPPKHDLVFHDAPNVNETAHTTINVELSPTTPDNDLSHTHRPLVPIIKDWISNSVDDSEPVETSISAANLKTAIPKSKTNGNSKNRRTCFVCKSLTYLIKDCDYYEKKMAQTPARNHAQRGNQQYYARMTLLNPQRHVVLITVLTKSKLVPLTAARPVTTAVPQTHVTRPKHVKPVVTKPHSPPRRHINRRLSPKPGNFPLKVTTVKAPMVNVVKGVQGNWGNPQHALKDKGVIDSGCSRHMTRNMSYLSDFEEINGGYVAFGRNPKGGKISGKGKIRTGKTVVATSSTEAEYVAAASCCAQVLWIQNQLLDYGPDQTVSGKDSSNPLMADNLPKIVWANGNW